MSSFPDAVHKYDIELKLKKIAEANREYFKIPFSL